MALCDKWRDTTQCHGLTILTNVFSRIIGARIVAARTAIVGCEEMAESFKFLDDTLKFLDQSDLEYFPLMSPEETNLDFESLVEKYDLLQHSQSLNIESEQRDTSTNVKLPLEDNDS